MAWERWRRVPEPNACDFCLTLASRGAVYKSKITAAGKRYHRMCRCTAAVEGKFSARNDTAIPEQDANRIVKMRVTKKGKTYVYVYDLSKFPRLKPPPKVKTPAPVSNGVKAATPQPVTTGSFADRIAALRAKYRRDTERSEWIGRVGGTRNVKLEAESAALKAELAELRDKRDLILQYWQKNIPLPDDLAQGAGSPREAWVAVDAAMKKASRRVKLIDDALGDGKVVASDLASGNLDTVLEAGDEVLKRVEDIVDRSPLAAKKADIAAAKELLDEAKKAADGPGRGEIFELDMNERLLGHRVTISDVVEDSPKYRKILEEKGLTFEYWEREARFVRVMQTSERSARLSEWNDAAAQLRALKAEYKALQGEVWRDAVAEVTGKVRPLGGKGTTFTSPKTGKPLTSKSAVAKLLNEASQVYPTEWLEAQSKRFPVLNAATTKRGYFSASRSEIRISGNWTVATKADPKGMFPTAVHELGHSMESSIADLSRLEWVWLRRRAGFETDSPTKRTTIRPKEYGYEDDFTSHYTGRTYDNASKNLDGPDRFYEVFTTGVEALFGGEIDDYMMRKNKTGFDRDFARFILGVMVIV